MKKIKFLLPILTIGALAPMTTIVSCGNRGKQHDYDGPLDVEINDEGDGIIVYGFSDFEYCEEKLVIPSTITLEGRDYPVVEIADFAFFNTSFIKEVELPDSVKTIKDGAFSSCSNLEKINIPAKVTSITGGVFAYCPNMKHMVVDPNNPIYTSRVGTKEENCIIKIDTMEIICGWKEYIPDGIKIIGSSAFCGTKIINLGIPSSVETIGYRAFAQCEGLETIRFREDNTASSLKTIERSAFNGCRKLLEFKAPSQLEKIGDYSFENCSTLETVVLNNHLQSIGDDAFSHTALTEINIPASVNDIGVAPFAYCEALEKITVDVDNQTYTSRNTSSVQCNCIIEKENGESIGIVQGCKKTTSVENIATIKSIMESSFAGCQIQRFNFPTNTKFIHPNAFCKCTQLQSISDFPDSLEWIAEGSFYNTQITSLHIPKNVSDISKSAFNGCDQLETIQVDSANTHYKSTNSQGEECNCIIKISGSDETLLQGCNNSQIPDVDRIGPEAFAEFKELSTVTIPISVIEIGEHAFNGCHALAEINYEGTIAQFESIDKLGSWAKGIIADHVQCTDGQWPIPPSVK